MFRRKSEKVEVADGVQGSAVERKLDEMSERLVALMDLVANQTNVIQQQGKEISELKAMLARMDGSHSPRPFDLRNMGASSSPRSSDFMLHPSPVPPISYSPRIRIELDGVHSDTDSDSSSGPAQQMREPRRINSQEIQLTIQPLPHPSTPPPPPPPPPLPQPVRKESVGFEDEPFLIGNDVPIKPIDFGSLDAASRMCIYCLHATLRHPATAFPKAVAWALCADDFSGREPEWEAALQSLTDGGWLRYLKGDCFIIPKDCPIPAPSPNSRVVSSVNQELKYYQFWADELGRLSVLGIAKPHLERLVHFILASPATEAIVPIAISLSNHISFLAACRLGGLTGQVQQLSTPLGRLLCEGQDPLDVTANYWTQASPERRTAILLCFTASVDIHHAVQDGQAWMEVAMHAQAGLHPTAEVAVGLLCAAVWEQRGDKPRAWNVLHEVQQRLAALLVASSPNLSPPLLSPSLPSSLPPLDSPGSAPIRMAVTPASLSPLAASASFTAPASALHVVVADTSPPPPSLLPSFGAAWLSLLSAQAHLLVRLERVDDALALWSYILDLCHHLYDRSHWQVATAMLSFAALLDQTHHLEDALSLLEEAVDLHKKVFGSKHYLVAQALLVWASGLAHAGQKESALLKQEQACSLLKASLGPKHEEVGRVSMQMALLLEDLGKSTLAVSAWQTALAIYAQEECQSHAATRALILHHMGSNYKKLGRREDALAFYQQAHQLRRSHLGELHPDVAVSCHSIGILLDECKRPEESLDYFQQAVLIRRQVYGQHVATADSLFSVGILLKQLQHKEAALAAYQEALEMRVRVLGRHTESVAMTMRVVAITLDSLQRHEEALLYFEEACDIRRRLYPGDHVLVADCLLSIGIVLKSMGQKEKAAERYQQCATMRATLLGKKHPSVRSTIRTLAGLLKELGRLEEAAMWERRMYE